MKFEYFFRFKFKCCHLGDAKFIRRDCHTTHYMNNWDGDMAFVVPKNYYLSAVTSIHDNRFEYDISFDVLLAYEFSKYTERLQSLQGRTWDFFLSAGVNSAHAGIQGSPVYRQGF